MVRAWGRLCCSGVNIVGVVGGGGVVVRSEPFYVTAEIKVCDGVKAAVFYGRHVVGDRGLFLSSCRQCTDVELVQI